MSSFEGERKRNLYFYTFSMLLLILPLSALVPFDLLNSNVAFIQIVSDMLLSFIRLADFKFVLVAIKSSLGTRNEMWFSLSAVWVKAN